VDYGRRTHPRNEPVPAHDLSDSAIIAVIATIQAPFAKKAYKREIILLVGFLFVKGGFAKNNVEVLWNVGLMVVKVSFPKHAKKFIHDFAAAFANVMNLDRFDVA
jgi:hypothetical protein